MSPPAPAPQRRPADRPLLVLLPGMDGTGLMFEPFVKALGGFRTRVVRYPEGLTSYSACLHFARVQLPRDRPFILLGESFSGPVAMALAAEQPEGLVALVLCGTFARNPRPGLAWLAPLLGLLPARRLPLFLIRYLLLGQWATEPLLDRVWAMLPQVPAPTLKGRLRSVLSVDHTPILWRIQVPVLVLRGDQDRLVPPEATDWLRTHLPSLDIATLHGPHWLLQTRPEAATQALVAFLDRLPAPVDANSEEVAAPGRNSHER